VTDKPTLTLANIRTLARGADLWCHVVKGLHVRHGSSGYRWRYYYRAHDGARRVLVLGSWPSMPVEDARDAARAHQLAVAKGADPSASRQELRDAPRVADLVAAYFERKGPELGVRTLPLYRASYARHAAAKLDGLRVASVTAEQLQAVINATAKRGGPGAARTLRTMLCSLFKFAERIKWRPRHTNPASETERLPDPLRNVLIQPEQMALIDQELERERAEHPYHVAVIWCVLLCGSRITEMATARRDQMSGNFLTLEEHKTAKKTGKARRIYLPAPAREEIAALPEHESGYIFGPVALVKQPKGTVWDTWKRVRERAGLPHVRPQDLRRTWASAAKSTGYSLDQIAEPMGHQPGSDATGRYAWLWASTGSEIGENVASTIKGLTKGETK
jgi:integrase